MNVFENNKVKHENLKIYFPELSLNDLNELNQLILKSRIIFINKQTK